MKAAAASLLRIVGSGQFFSVWSWVITLPIAVTVMGGYDTASTVDARLTGIAIAVGVHVVLGIGGCAAAWLERRALSVRARVVVVVIGVTVITVCRPLLLAGGAQASGFALFDGPILARIATNLIVGSTVLFIVASVVVAVRTRQDAAARLRTVLTALDSQREHDSRDVESLTEQVLNATRTSILSALPTGITQEFDAAQASAALKRFSEEVVRPLSHKLFDSAAEPAPTELLQGSAEKQPRAKLRTQLADLIEPAPAWITAVPYVALWAPYALVRMPTSLSLVLAALAVALAVAGNLVVRRVLAARTVRMRAVLLVAAYAAVAAVTSAAVAIVGDFQFVAQFVVANIILYPAFALFLAAGRAGFDLLARNEAELARAIDERATLAATAHNRVLLARRRVARTLHADVQAECVAAAITMAQRDGFTESDWERVIHRIEALLSNSVRASTDSKAAFEAMLAAWRHSLDITVDVAPVVWSLLDDDSARLELVMDAVSEALTNVIRHADAPRAHVAMAPSATAAVTLDVSSPGTITSAATDGYGIAQLAARATGVELRQIESSVCLRLRIA